MTPAQFKAIRQKHGSQRAVAKKLGVGYRSIQRAEAGDVISKRNELLIMSLENDHAD